MAKKPSERRAKVRPITRLSLRCDFCGDTEDEAETLIAAPCHLIHICDKCVKVCGQMLTVEEPVSS